jgi:alkanesulfonate monooxygenase SsuD/methylene tetrahydromethanopterin reductase-like flavin-dependent oxidoreductase (luciferase family)
MLHTAGAIADGTVTWMAGLTALRSYLVPAIQDAASKAGRPSPRIVAGVPVAVVDDEQAGREAAGQQFEVYGRLENYRRILDRGEAEGPAEIAITGSEKDVALQLDEYSAAGVTDLVAMPYSVGSNPSKSIERTWDLLADIAKSSS